MSASMPMEGPKADEPLADPALRRFLLDFVRRRVASADADDIVQTVLVEALTAKNRPQDHAELRKYLLGIARHKVADTHRRSSREELREPPELVSGPPPIEEEALVRWAERQAPATEEAQKTLAWMAREGEGEKLESIAEEERVPAARVRQRVSRMRRWMKERWLAELAAVAALAVVAFVLYRVFKKPDGVEAILPDASTHPAPETPLDRAKLMRAEALERCGMGEFERCLEGLDQAKALDPAGDLAPEVKSAREAAARALNPAPIPSSTAPETKTNTKSDSKSDTNFDSKSAPSPTSTTKAPAPKSTSTLPKKPVPKGEKGRITPVEDFQKSSPVTPKPSKKDSFQKK